MKKIICYFFLLAFAIVAFPAQGKTHSIMDNKISDGNMGNFSLTIKLDSSFNHHICDSAILTTDCIRFRGHWIYDSPSKSYHYQWKNLPVGYYTFNFQTFFNYSQSISFYLSKDTSFEMSNTMGLEFIPIFSISDLLKADTIKILYKVSGCFNSYFERISLFKIDHERYTLVNRFDSIDLQYIQGRHMFVAIPVEKSKIIFCEVMDSLFQLMDSSRNMKNRVLRSKNLRISTTRHELYMVIGKKMFEFNDFGMPEWDLYSRFRKGYLP
jgi:hypothetical protein